MKKETEKKYTLNPLHNYVIVRPLTETEMGDIEHKKTSIIITTESEKRGKTMFADVVAVGPGKFIDTSVDMGRVLHKYAPITVKPGERVIFSEYDGNELFIQGERFFSVREEFIHCKICDLNQK